MIVPARIGRWAILAILCAALGGCARRLHADRTYELSGPTDSAVYKGRYVAADGESGRFKAWVWAALPDRLHVEVYGPMGGTRMVMDGGGGKLLVVDLRKKAAHAGNAAERELTPVLGVGLTLGELVRGLTGREAPAGLDHWLRDPPSGSGLPLRLEAGLDGSRLELFMLHRHALPAGAEERLGTGRPPDGWEGFALEEILPEVRQ